MQGPHDEEILASRVTDSAESRDTTRLATPASRPPGGKALLRLLELLDSRGYDDLAAAAIQAAVPADARPMFEAYLDKNPTTSTTPARKGARSKDAKETSPEVGLPPEARATAEGVANEHIAAVRRAETSDGSPMGLRLRPGPSGVLSAPLPSRTARPMARCG